MECLWREFEYYYCIVICWIILVPMVSHLQCAVLSALPCRAALQMPEMPRQCSPELVNLMTAMLQREPEKRPSVNRILRDPFIRKWAPLHSTPLSLSNPTISYYVIFVSGVDSCTVHDGVLVRAGTSSSSWRAQSSSAASRTSRPPRRAPSSRHRTGPAARAPTPTVWSRAAERWTRRLCGAMWPHRRRPPPRRPLLTLLLHPAIPRCQPLRRRPLLCSCPVPVDNRHCHRSRRLFASCRSLCPSPTVLQHLRNLRYF